MTEKPIILDFVYGDIDDYGILTPLDGQQRLTTLFLLHWYAAKKEDIAPTETDFLEKFSYATRPRFTLILRKIGKFQADFQRKKFIFRNRKSIMVSARLNKKFIDVKNLREKLKSGDQQGNF